MSLKTEVNTTISKAFGAGEDEFFKDLEKDGEIVAYQWSAILDDSTTEGCEELDGIVYEVTDPVWENLHRPRHWNCRSLKLAIFDGEEYIADEDIGVYDEM
jgi:SPP1 gp7 family putative phage head morphogenesis protein